MIEKWIKYNCVNCPASIGLDAANENLDYAYNNQYLLKNPGMELKEDVEDKDDVDKTED